MFKTARIRLTLWYLLIIMMVSVIFSFTIYNIQGREVERFARQRLIRTQLELYHGNPPPFFSSDTMLPRLEQDLIRDAEAHILLSLFVANCVILVFSGVLAYLLAGKTLRPIQNMVYEQHRFISDASHELRTPLTALKTSLEVSLRDRDLNLSGAKKTISESVQDVNRLQALSENLLQLTQYQSTNGRNDHRPVSLTQAVSEAIHKIEPLAKKKNITIHYHKTPVMVNGNSYGLVDLAVILLDNAVKYSHSGSSLQVSVQRKDRLAVLSVADRGMGIAAKDLPRIFDRFYRADTARTKTARGGYGLGLSIAKKIAEVHRGKISVESEPGTGSVFTVTFPAAN